MKGNSLSDQIYEDLVMRRCSHCAHTRVYRLSDGRVKCWPALRYIGPAMQGITQKNTRSELRVFSQRAQTCYTVFGIAPKALGCWHVDLELELHGAKKRQTGVVHGRIGIAIAKGRTGT